MRHNTPVRHKDKPNVSAGVETAGKAHSDVAGQRSSRTCQQACVLAGDGDRTPCTLCVYRQRPQGTADGTDSGAGGMIRRALQEW